MTKDEAERFAKRRNNGPQRKIGLDGWRYVAKPHAGAQGGYAVYRARGDVAATELFRIGLS